MGDVDRKGTVALVVSVMPLIIQNCTALRMQQNGYFMGEELMLGKSWCRACRSRDNHRLKVYDGSVVAVARLERGQRRPKSV